MPTYEYPCQACSLRPGRRQAVTEQPLSECPSCGGKLRSLLSRGAGGILRP